MSHIHFKVVFTLAAMLSVLIACSNAAPKKQGSIWDQRRDAIHTEAPTAAEELSVVDQNVSNVELSYQAEPLNSFIADTETLPADKILPESRDIEQEILAMPATYYTVQLLASVDYRSSVPFCRKESIICAIYCLHRAR
jgi:septal ring-binding cell division protein DamX